MGGEAGLRAGEMRALQWTDVDFTRRQLRVARSEWHGHLTATKGGRVRYVPLTRRLEAALRAAQPGTRKTDEVLRREHDLPFRESHVVDLLIKVARGAEMPPHVRRTSSPAGRSQPKLSTSWRFRSAFAPVNSERYGETAFARNQERRLVVLRLV